LNALSLNKIKFLQVLLNKTYHFSLSEDGIIGKKTLSAIESKNMVNLTWPSIRKQIGALQLLIKTLGVDSSLVVDGYWGPGTQAAYDDAKDLIDNKSQWQRPTQVHPVHATAVPNLWPSSDTNSLKKFYGNPGTNHGKVLCPYPLKLAWDLDVVVNRFTANTKIIDATEQALEMVLEHYGINEIIRLKLDLWGGCYANRTVRGSSNTISTHAFACSIDWNPTENRLRWNKNRASFAKPEYDFWWKAWDDVGAKSLGRTKNFDWMHVQFTK